MDITKFRSREAAIDSELDELAGKMSDGTASDADRARYRQLAAIRSAGMMPTSMRAKIRQHRRLKGHPERLVG